MKHTFLDKKGLVHWLQLACTLHEVSQYYQFEEGNFRRRNQSAPSGRLLSAILGEVLVRRASLQSYQGYLLHSNHTDSEPFLPLWLFQLLHIFQGQVTHQLQIYPQL